MVINRYTRSGSKIASNALIQTWFNGGEYSVRVRYGLFSIFYFRHVIMFLKLVKLFMLKYALPQNFSLQKLGRLYNRKPDQLLHM